MKRKTIKQKYEDFISPLRPMTWSQRMDHLWTYYKLHFLLIVGIPVLVISFVVNFIKNDVDILLSGELVNIFITDEGKEYLDGGAFAYFEGNSEKKQVVNLDESHFDDLETSQQPDYDYASVMKVVAKTTAKELDYMIMNEYGFRMFMTQGILMDLSQVFTQEELKAFEEEKILIKAQLQDSDVFIPVALDISQLDFSKDCITNKGRVFLSFCASSPRAENCREFWDYFHNWKDRK